MAAPRRTHVPAGQREGSGAVSPPLWGDLVVREQEPSGLFLTDDGTWQEVLPAAAPSPCCAEQFIAAGTLLTRFSPEIPPSPPVFKPHKSMRAAQQTQVAVNGPVPVGG